MKSLKLAPALLLLALTTPANSAITVYKCVPGPGVTCPSTVVIRRPPAQPFTESTSTAAENTQNNRLAALENTTAHLGHFRLEAGGLLDTDANFGIEVGIGGAWQVGDRLALADAEFIAGRTQAGNSGFLLGAHGDFLFIIADWFRAGPGVDLTANFGDEHISFGPDLGLEIGPANVHGILRAALPIVVADGKANGGVDPGLFTLAIGGRL